MFQDSYASIVQRQNYLLQMEEENPVIREYVLLKEALDLDITNLKKVAASEDIEQFAIGNTNFKKIVRTDITYPIEQIQAERPDLFAAALSFDKAKAKEIRELNAFAVVKEVPYYRGFALEDMPNDID